MELTKETGYWDRIGQDIVAMCANDILCLGASPLFFLDYYATGELDVDCSASIIRGIAEACQTIGCALVGGETAEMPGVYQPGDFDIAGFIVGWVSEEALIDGTRIEVGDAVLGIASSGFHSNGYSLLRKIISDQRLNMESLVPGTPTTLGDALTEPTRLYGPVIEALFETQAIHGLAHITGGGLIGNLPRILPENCRVTLERSSWERSPVMSFIEELGGIPPHEMVQVFNDGVGMVLIVSPDQSAHIQSQLQAAGETVWELGIIETRQAGQAPVELV